MEYNSASGSRLLLNGEWEFVEGPDGKPPDGGWKRIRVPHRSREFETNPPDSGWFRTMLKVPANWRSKNSRIVLDLGRVRHFGRAYLDRTVVGEHYHMRYPWMLDLSNRIRFGVVYELLIYTHSCSGVYAHPEVDSLSEEAEKALDTRFWYSSAATIGMEGDVWLCLKPHVCVEDLYIITSVREQKISVEATICNEFHERFFGRLSWRIKRAEQTVLELPDFEIDLKGGEEQVICASALWVDPVLWGRPPYGEPILYFLQADVSMGTDLVDQIMVRFGFREIWAEEDRLLLNGEQLVPWGDHTIPYVYERQWLTRKFVDLANANISIVEHHRYDPPSVFYDVADELGIFVVGANFCVGTGQVPGKLDQDEIRLVMEHHLLVADTWIRRVRNHPSILFWDITDARDPDFCVPLLRRVKALDQTRIAEVTFDHTVANAELVELIDCYRLFSSLEHIEATICEISSNPNLPVKPVRVGEAGIFDGADWGSDKDPPLMDGWWDFLLSIRKRNLHGLQTFHLVDMDYRDFVRQVPGNLSSLVHPQIHWPSHSGQDARIDPFGEGSQKAWGKSAIYLNWCDPSEPVSRPTSTHRWSRDLFQRLAGRDIGSLNSERIPEVIVCVKRAGEPETEAYVFVEPMDGQNLKKFGVRADKQGASWFVLPEPGMYRFLCQSVNIEIETKCQQIQTPAGYDHIQYVELDLVFGEN
ncbi:hypothetical protein CMK22_11205 [Candidatus Poribacteria bacterium]|nr:hypothetical protein [Candidatus Poribacteria bacterium]